MSQEERLHRALANPLRRRILSTLRARDEPVDVQQLAADLDVHVNTVRAHLATLEEAELVASDPQPRDRPGRPRLAYRATAQATDVEADTPGYRFLAQMLAGYLSSTADDPSGVAQGIGTAWGQHLIDRPAPFEQLDTDEGIGRLVRLLDEFGFAPELEDEDGEHPHIDLRRCPFLDVAREHQDVVCAIHLGLMRGALDELGVTVEATALHPFVEPDRCVTDLKVPA